MIKNALNVCLNQVYQPKGYRLETKKTKVADSVFDLHVSVCSASFEKDVVKSHSFFAGGSFQKDLNYRFLKSDSIKKDSFLTSRVSQSKIVWFNDSGKKDFSIIELTKFSAKVQFLNTYPKSNALFFVPSLYLNKSNKNLLPKFNSFKTVSGKTRDF